MKLGFFVFFWAPFAWGAVSLEVERVFIPPLCAGRDAVLVVEVSLPDPCYVLRSMGIDWSGKNLTIKPLGERDKSGACATEDDLPEAEMVFEANLGRLSPGDYTLSSGRSFEVDASCEQESLVARVSAVEVKDVYLPGSSVSVSLSGEACGVPSLSWKRFGNVLTVFARANCAEGRATFSESISFGTLLPGEYLLRVPNGVNGYIDRVFQVLER